MKDEQLRVIRMRIRLTAKGELIGRLLQYTNLCTNDVAVSDVERTEMQKRYERSFCRHRQTFEDLRDFLRGEEVEDAFLRCFEEDVKIEAALQHLYPERLVVTDSDISNTVENVRRYNINAAATNAMICALATNVLKKIRAGGDFAAIADEFSMDPDRNPGGDLGECSIASFADEGEECMVAAAALKVGEVSSILLGNNGYMILKKTGDGTYAQIFFRKPYKMEELSGDELVADLKKEKRTGLVEELLESFARSSKIEYPQGDVFLKFDATPNKRSIPLKKRKP